MAYDRVITINYTIVIAGHPNIIIIFFFCVCECVCVCVWGGGGGGGAGHVR